MLTILKNKLIDSENPAGVKRASNWKLPPPDFAYGKKEEADKEGVNISKLLI